MVSCKTCGYVVTDDGLECVCNTIQQANIRCNSKPTYEEAKKAYRAYQSGVITGGEFHEILTEYFKDEVLK